MEPENQRVLVGCPVYDGMEYCFDEFLNSIKSFDYSNYDILLVENSRDKKFYNKIKKIDGIRVIYKNMKEEKNMRRLVRARNKILDYFLERDYDYLLMMDADVIAPPNIIKELIKQNKDIISGLYFNYFFENGREVVGPIAWESINEAEFEWLKNNNRLPYGCKVKEDVKLQLSAKKYMSNLIYEVIMPSAGCMLIKKEVLRKGARYGILQISEITNKRGTSGDDVYFMREAFRRGFRAYCHTGIKCRHLIQGKFIGEKKIHPLEL